MAKSCIHLVLHSAGGGLLGHRQCAAGVGLAAGGMRICCGGELIRVGDLGLNDILLTLDAHECVDIAHPSFRQRGEVLPCVLSYLDVLEAAGCYVHVLWPSPLRDRPTVPQCSPAVCKAYNRGEEANAAVAHKVFKGGNPWADFFCVIQIEVPDADDADPQASVVFLARLAAA